MAGKTETCGRGSIVNVSVIRKCVHCWLYYSENPPITEQKFFFDVGRFHLIQVLYVWIIRMLYYLD